MKKEKLRLIIIAAYKTPNPPDDRQLAETAGSTPKIIEKLRLSLGLRRKCGGRREKKPEMFERPQIIEERIENGVRVVVYRAAYASGYSRITRD
jgi:hypothetical protein